MQFLNSVIPKLNFEDVDIIILHLIPQIYAHEPL